jgi:hypothetical protein
MLSLILISMGGIVMAQVELPEPTAPVITYTHQIAWGSKPLMWIDIVPKSSAIFLTPAPSDASHIYYALKLGDHRWSFEMSDSTIALPKVMECVFSIMSIPSGKIMDIYRMRVRATATYPDGTLSSVIVGDESYWVMVIDLSKIKPKTPIKRVD